MISKIGDSVWLDPSTYGKNDKIVELKVTGETPRSWIVTNHGAEYKIPKNHTEDNFKIKTSYGHSPVLWLSEIALQRNIWVNTHGYLIIEDVGRISRNYDMLIKLAKLIGYKSDEPG
jgi:hypothetical protein